MSFPMLVLCGKHLASPLLQATLPSSTPCPADRHIDRNVNSGHLAIAGYVRCSRSLTFAKLLPYAKGLRFVVANLLVDDLQLVKGRGSIVSVEITESNCTVGCR